MKHHRRHEPELETMHLCWEPQYTEARVVLTDLKNLLEAVAVTPPPVLKVFMEQIQTQLVELEVEHAETHADWVTFNARQELRIVNEEQLQGAVKFLTAVWQGEITDATMEQIAAARCFMRAE